jgi:hypothetical protein
MKLIIGVIQFFEESEDEDKRAVIERIDAIIHCETENQAVSIGEEFIHKRGFDSYIIPEEYNGDIEYYGADYETRLHEFLNR